MKNAKRIRLKVMLLDTRFKKGAVYDATIDPLGHHATIWSNVRTPEVVLRREEYEIIEDKRMS